MTDKLIHLLLAAAKTIGSKYFDRLADRLIERLDQRKLVFTKTKAVVIYSHFVGRNHVREGGQKKLIEGRLSLAVYNPNKKPRIFRDLTLCVTVDNCVHPFGLYDHKARAWDEDYTLAPHHITGLSWDASPKGHGLSLRWGAEGIIPVDDLDSVSLSIKYLDEHGRHHQVPIDSVKIQRIPVEQIAE